MKVVHVLNTGGYSGAENVVITIINHLKKQNIDCVYLSPYGEIADRLEKEGIKYYAVDHLSVSVLKKAFSDLQPDIVHAHDFTASIMVALSHPHAKVISHIHNNSPWLKKINSKSLAFLYASLCNDQILTVSDSVEKDYVFGKLIHNKIKCVGNPVDLSVIREKADRAQCDEKFDVIFLGRLTEAKNPKMIVEVFDELCRKYSQIRIAIVGDGEERNFFHEKLDQYKNIKFFGFMDNPYPILNNSKVLFLPSKWEGFGLVAVESLALGVPVVTSGAGGLKNIVNDQCGFIGNSKEDYVKEFDKLFLEDDYYKEKRESALARAKSLENINEYMGDMIKLYKHLCNRKEFI